MKRGEIIGKWGIFAERAAHQLIAAHRFVHAEEVDLQVDREEAWSLRNLEEYSWGSGTF
jgi:hypothetical protein